MIVSDYLANFAALYRNHLYKIAKDRKDTMNKTAGWINGFLGVLIFSGSLPATRLAVIDIDPTFLTMARATIAGLLGLILLLAFREPFPRRNDVISLIVVALGVVVGFPLLTGIALQYMTSAHAIVFIGLLPLSTALFAVLRGGENPRPLFWLFSVAGASSLHLTLMGRVASRRCLGMS